MLNAQTILEASMTPYKFHWPDPANPRFVTRDLTLLRAPKKGRRQPGLKLTGIRLIELIPQCLYEVPVDCDEEAQRVRELRPGCILSRNLKLSDRLNGGPVQSQIDERFISYDGVFKARRGLGKVDRKYKAHEIPSNRALAGSLDWLMRSSWELQASDEEGRAAFVLTAREAAKKYGAPIDVHKVAAQQRAVQAGDPTDSLGRFNPGRIPLICFAGERQVARRIQAVRGIGRRMSFREAVLEHYVDRLQEICLEVERSQAYRLRDSWLAKDSDRTPTKVRAEAARLEDAARKLRSFVTRPRSRAFSRCANDLEHAARLLRGAADDRNSHMVSQAKEQIAKVYRAMIEAQCHWRLEEVLLLVDTMLIQAQIPGRDRKGVLAQEIKGVHEILTRRDPVTGKNLEHGFENPVLPKVSSRVHLAWVFLIQRDGPDLERVKADLTLACEPL
jgi:hypothetical protein